MFFEHHPVKACLVPTSFGFVHACYAHDQEPSENLLTKAFLLKQVVTSQVCREHAQQLQVLFDEKFENAAGIFF